LNDPAVRATQPDHAPIRRKRRQRIESGVRYVQANPLEILACGAASAQAEIQDELIDC
jgi:hypothetical protein